MRKTEVPVRKTTKFILTNDPQFDCKMAFKEEWALKRVAVQGVQLPSTCNVLYFFICYLAALHCPCRLLRKHGRVIQQWTSIYLTSYSYHYFILFIIIFFLIQHLCLQFKIFQSIFNFHERNTALTIKIFSRNIPKFQPLS